MKWILLAIFSLTLLRVNAQDQDYIQVYSYIEQGDTLAQSGRNDQAVERYREALKGLKRLQSIYPTWNREVLQFRVDYVNGKLQSLQTNKSPQEVAPSTAPKKTNPFLEELQRLKNQNTNLEEKLRRANSAQTNAASAEELEKLRKEIVQLEKQRDRLKSQLQEARKAEDQVPKKSNATNSVNRDKEIEQLRARLEAVEARPVPFTPEELAMFKQSPQQLAPIEPKPVKKSRELPPGAGTLVAQAERAFAARRLDEAEAKYQEVLRQDESNIYILGNLAATQLEKNDISAAEKNIQTALQNDPEDAFCLTLLGIIRFRQNNYDEALDLLSRAAKINPENAETQNYLGITLSQKGQRAAAEAALRKAVQLQPNYAGAHHNLAVIYATQRPPFLELARWHYERALSLGHPKNPELEKILNK